MASHVQDPPRVTRDDLGGPEQLSAHKVRSRLLVVSG